MQDEGASPNSITLVCGLKACGFSKHDVHNFSKALELHSNLSIDRLQDNMEVFSPFVGCFSLLWMYIESFL